MLHISRTFLCLLLLAFATTFVGCAGDEDQPDPAAQEIEQLNLQVAQAAVLLQKSRAECDELSAALAGQTEKLVKLQADYDAVLAQRDALQSKFDQVSQTQQTIARQAQDAQRTNDNLQRQLQEQIDQAQELQNYNRELNVSIERLQNQPRPEPVQPEEQPAVTE